MKYYKFSDSKGREFESCVGRVSGRNDTTVFRLCMDSYYLDNGDSVPNDELDYVENEESYRIHTIGSEEQSNG